MTEGDPPRIGDAGTNDSVRLATLLNEARSDVGTDHELDALRASLGATLWNASGTGGNPAPQGGTGPAIGKAGAALTVKASIVVLLVASTVAFFVSRERQIPSQTGSPTGINSPGDPKNDMRLEASATVTVPGVPVVPGAVLAPIADSAPPPPSSNRATATRKVPDSAPSESALLGQAQAALSRNPTLALLLCEQHRAWYPRGMLVQEREVLAIDALKRSGRMTEASARAARFLKAFPASAHRSKVESLVPPPLP